MRLRIAFVIGVCAVVSAIAETKHIPPLIQIAYHPCRKVDGVAYNIQPVYDWIKSGEQFPTRECPMPEWGEVGATLISGGRVRLAWNHVIMSISDGGMLIGCKSEKGEDLIDTNACLLVNYPQQQDYLPGDRIAFIARHAGTIQFTNATGSILKLVRFDYGTPCEPNGGNTTDEAKLK